MPEQPEKGKGRVEVAQEVLEETNEPAFDIAIDMALGYVPSAAELSTLEGSTEQEIGFIEKLHRIQPEIDAFLATMYTRFKDDTEQENIRAALSLMIKLHIEQGDRSDTGIPFIGHPLAVAHDALNIMGDNEDTFYVCMAALLHDAVEDQSRLLALEKKFAVEHRFKEGEREEMERAGAVGGLEWLFDRRVAFLVTSLTSPIKVEDLESEEKNKRYYEYVSGIFSNIDSSPSVVKWADLKQNALTIGLIRQKAEDARREGDSVVAQKLENTYGKLKKKYRPVLTMVKAFFERLTDTQHPLYIFRDEALAAINQTFATEYAA